MAAIDSFVRINQRTYAWGSSIFQMDGLGIEGIVAVDFEEKLEIAVVHAAKQSGRPVAFAGNGKYTVPAFKIRMLKDTWSVVQQAMGLGPIGLMLGSPGLGSFGDPLWTFSMQAVEPIVGMVPITAVFTPCKITGRREAREEGIKELVTELDIATLSMVENGIPFWSVVRDLI
jgi:hypothetical protein